MKSILPDQYEVEKQFNSRADDFLSSHGVSKIMNESGDGSLTHVEILLLGSHRGQAFKYANAKRAGYSLTKLQLVIDRYISVLNA